MNNFIARRLGNDSQFCAPAVHHFYESNLRPLIIEVDHSCNMKCLYCYNNSKFDRDGSINNAEIHNNRVINIIDKFSSDSNSISLLGGEPFLFKHILSIIEHAKRLNFKKIVINTNGMSISSEQILYLTNNKLVTVAISIPATEKNKFEYITGVTGAYDAVRSNIRTLMSLGINTHLSFIGDLSDDNINSFIEELKLTHGIITYSTHSIEYVGRARKNYKLAKNEPSSCCGSNAIYVDWKNNIKHCPFDKTV